MSLTPAEQKARKLARMSVNTVCLNLGTAKKFGFSTVCIKFHTFVCKNCKSSHQAISHQWKSLITSSWSDDEVAELQRKGNDFACRTWLKNAPPPGSGGREGDDFNFFKQFVVKVQGNRGPACLVRVPRFQLAYSFPPIPRMLDGSAILNRNLVR